MSVTLHTTLGDIKLELFCDKCPKACENFLALCASGYYKDNVFTRNIREFMVQTGDPTNTGKGGESIWGTPFEDEFHQDLKHNQRGILSMANNGPNKNKSQFFITYKEHPHLDLKYTVFGRVIDGFDVLEELETQKVDAKFRPVVEQRIRDVTIHANPIADQQQLLSAGITHLQHAHSHRSPLLSRSLITSVRRNIVSTNSSLNAEPRDHQPLLSTPVKPSVSASKIEGEHAVHIKQMQDYFSQYIEEYYEDDSEDDDISSVAIVQKSKEKYDAEHKLESLPDTVRLLEDERARDIVVLDLAGVRGATTENMVICSPFNARHGKALAEKLRKCAKVTLGNAPMSRRQTDNSAGWFTVEFGNIQVHVMDEISRRRFDLEALWSGGEENEMFDSFLDDANLLPPSD